MNKHSILIIEDHPIIQSAYKDAFQKYSTDFGVEFSIRSVESCEDTVAVINDYVTKRHPLAMVFLDIRVPNKTSIYLSGEDIGIDIRKRLPNVKIVVATSLNDNYRVHSIMRSINPDGFIIKNDFDAKGVIAAIGSILNDEPYYSKSVLQFLRQQISSDLLLDAMDRKILHELSLGAKTSDLPSLIPLSLGGVENRKRKLKEIFNVKTSDDRELIFNAKEKGFI